MPCPIDASLAVAGPGAGLTSPPPPFIVAHKAGATCFRFRAAFRSRSHCQPHRWQRYNALTTRYAHQGFRHTSRRSVCWGTTPRFEQPHPTLHALPFQFPQEPADCCVTQCFGETMVAHHAGDVQRFHHHRTCGLRYRGCSLPMVSLPLIRLLGLQPCPLLIKPPTSVGVGSSCRFGRQWYAIVAYGTSLVVLFGDAGQTHSKSRHGWKP